VLKVALYETEDGWCPFATWFERLDGQAASKMTGVIARMEAGNFGDVKSVGDGVLERRIDWGPGYRLYFGRDGDQVVVLLIGGTKRRQSADVDAAKRYWADYRKRRKGR
jgi:putative addiction module killer protein